MWLVPELCAVWQPQDVHEEERQREVQQRQEQPTEDEADHVVDLVSLQIHSERAEGDVKDREVDEE